MALSAEHQFQKALYLLDQGEVVRGEALLRDVIASSSDDVVLETQARVCLGELLVGLDRSTEAAPMFHAALMTQIPDDLDDVLDVELEQARRALAEIV